MNQYEQSVVVHGFLFEPDELDAREPVEVFIWCNRCGVIVECRDDREHCRACGAEVADKAPDFFYHLLS